MSTAVTDEPPTGDSIAHPPPAPPARQGAAAAAPLEGEEGDPPAEPYYWEEGGDPDVDWWAKVRHALHFGGVKAIAGAESIGEVVANTLGLNDSKYQYVIDALEADEYRRQREERDEQDRRQMEIVEQAARNTNQEERQGKDANEDMEAVELGDAVVSLAGDDEGNGSVAASAVTGGTSA